MNEEKKNIVAVLAAVQASVKAPKNQVNKFAGYSFRSLEDILEAAKPITSKLGAAIVITDDIVLIGSRYYVKATASFLYDGESIQASAFAREPEEKKGNDAMQITGTASSYARKYAVSSLLCLDDTKDIDSEDNRDKKATAKPTAPTAAAQPTAPTTKPLTASQKPSGKAADIPPEVSAALAYAVPFGAHKGETLGKIYKTEREEITTIRGDAAFRNDDDTMNALNIIDAYIRKQKEGK